jgi:RNA polymerase sigma-70 factor (ECF subfamily)
MSLFHVSLIYGIIWPKCTAIPSYFCAHSKVAVYEHSMKPCVKRDVATTNTQSRRGEKVICLSKPDTTLIARCQSDDTGAFDQIVVRYKQKIFQYIYRMVGDSEEAEDLTQEVFVKTYLALPTFRSQSSLNTWLYRIAGNLCIDAHRKRVRKETATGGATISLDEPYSSSGDAGGDSGTTREIADIASEPFAVLEKRELDGQIQMALAKLPEKMRSVVVLHDLEGLQYEEIAVIVDCPLGTVKSRLFNARIQLRDHLKSYLEA